MGLRGPAPESTETLRLRGSWRAKTATVAVLPPGGKPRRPVWVKGPAKSIWDSVVGLDQVSRADRLVLGRYAVLVTRWQAAEDHVAEHGQTHMVGDVVKIHPTAKLAGQLADRLLRLEQQLGLTPSSRQRIRQPAKNKTADTKARFFGGEK